MDDLLQGFAAAWSGPAETLPRAELSAALHAIVDPARAAWPARWIDEQCFVQHLARHTGTSSGTGVIAALARMQPHAGDLWLACACSHGVVAALQAFDTAHLSALPRLLRRIDDSPAFVDELAQILREKLFVGDGERPARIAEYTGRGTLAGWVRVTVTRTALNLRRARTVVLARDGDALEAATDDDAALQFAKANYRGPFQDAVRAAVATLDARGRTLLRLHYVDGLSIDKIALLYGVHRSSIARWLSDTRNVLGAAIRTALRSSMGVSGRECDSMASALLSQMTLSLGSLLDPGTPRSGT